MQARGVKARVGASSVPAAKCFFLPFWGGGVHRLHGVTLHPPPYHYFSIYIGYNFFSRKKVYARNARLR